MIRIDVIVATLAARIAHLVPAYDKPHLYGKAQAVTVMATSPKWSAL